jgi:hypothetical protein
VPSGTLEKRLVSLVREYGKKEAFQTVLMLAQVPAGPQVPAVSKLGSCTVIVVVSAEASEELNPSTARVNPLSLRRDRIFCVVVVWPGGVGLFILLGMVVDFMLFGSGRWFSCKVSPRGAGWMG